VLLIVVILPLDTLSARTSFWISSPVVVRLLERDLRGSNPTRSDDIREFDTAEALFVREVLNPGICDAKGLAMPVGSAKCRLDDALMLDTDFLLGDLGDLSDEGPSERVEPVGTVWSPLVLVRALGIAGSARRR